MTQVLVLADHVPSRRQASLLGTALAQLDLAGAVVTVLMPPHPPTLSVLMDDLATVRGLPYASAAGDLKASRAAAQAEARHGLAHVVGSLQAAGCTARGELLARASTAGVLAEVEVRRPAAVVLLHGRRGLAHLLDHDLEGRLRKLGTVRVLVVHGRHVVG